MKIVSKSAPAVLQPGNAKAETQVSARDRAIAKFTEGSQQEQTTPVKNPSKVSVEEFGAIKSNSSESQGNSQPVLQNNTNEGTTTDTVSAETKTETTSQTDKLSSQYALLAKKERALRAEAQKIKAKEDALKAKEQEYQSKYIPKDRLSDPSVALDELLAAGVSYDTLTAALLSRGNPDQIAQNAAVQKIEAKLQALQDAQEAANKAVIAQQQASYQQALTQIKSEAKKLIQADPFFEVIRETNSVKDVVDLIERTYNEDGILLSVEEAAREVEDFLTEKAEKLARSKKVQSRLQPKKQESTAQTQQQTGTQTNTQTQMKTLTNSMSSSRQLSARERAILAFKGELNKS